MFQKLMVANRGEIACRIIKTAKKLGIKTLAIYSEADRNSFHVSSADEAYCVGPSEASKSYLNIKKILQIAEEMKVDAIHPGYGFLSENDIFAKKVESKGINFIGPGWQAIKTMGNKKNAKKAISKANIPFVPGYKVQANNLSNILENNQTIEYPLLIKAASGGGGKGMRIVLNEKELESGIQSVKREALSSFGNDEIIVEKYLQGGKHIEIQIASDHFGNTIHLMERDCSTQRRYQKVIEECPATSIPKVTKEKMYEAAIAISQTIKYTNLGTIEFIVDTSGKPTDNSFYFLEMNTRLQVEHPVTECVLGIDLVELQLRIAAGEKLPFKQPDINAKGHAIEARIYAEDPRNNFLPSSGNIRKIRFPKDARLDFGVKEGDTIESHYDPMLGKLIVHAKNRQLANQKMSECLKQFKIKGIQTNLDFLYQINHTSIFINDNMQVDSLQSIAEQFRRDQAISKHFVSASLLYLFLENQFAHKMWRIWGEGRSTLRIMYQDRILQVRVINKEDGFIIDWEDNSYFVSSIEIDKNVMEFVLDSDTIKYDFEHENEIVRLFDEGTIFEFKLLEDYVDGNKEEVNEGKVVAPITGTITKILKKNGQRVLSGEPLLIIEAMKMEYELKAPRDGRIRNLKIRTKEIINQNELLLEIDREK